MEKAPIVETEVLNLRQHSGSDSNLQKSIYSGKPINLDHKADNSILNLTTYHQEAYYLYFVAVAGLLLNLLVVIFVFVRRPLRKLTSAFLIHACFLDFLKAAYCIPIANNLVTQRKPSDTDCDFFGATYVLIITASAFNMLAMVCTEAYTFGEVNIGGNSKGSLCCIIFGTLLVYVASIILHLGPTLIAGYFDFHPEIGSCSFILGKNTGYVANVMWIVILTVTVIGIIHFICKLYKEIQVNHTNRVSMLVRSSITIMDDPMTSACNVQTMVNDSSHRAKLFVLSTLSFIFCWYPLFLLILIDVHFKVSPKVYQAFSFIAWSQGTIQPILYICFDRHVNLLAKYIYCDRYRQYSLATLAGWMNRDMHTTSHPTGHSVSDAEDPFQDHTHGNRQEVEESASVHSIQSDGNHSNKSASRENSPGSFEEQECTYSNQSNNDLDNASNPGEDGSMHNYNS